MNNKIAKLLKKWAEQSSEVDTTYKQGKKFWNSLPRNKREIQREVIKQQIHGEQEFEPFQTPKIQE